MKIPWQSDCIRAALFFTTMLLLMLLLFPASGQTGICPYCGCTTNDEAGDDCLKCDEIKSKLHCRQDDESGDLMKTVDSDTGGLSSHCFVPPNSPDEDATSNDQRFPQSFEQPETCVVGSWIFGIEDLLSANTEDSDTQESDPVQAHEGKCENDNFIGQLEDILLVNDVVISGSASACLPNTEAYHTLRTSRAVNLPSWVLAAANLQPLYAELQNLGPELDRGRVIIRIRFSDGTIALLHIKMTAGSVILSSDIGVSTSEMSWGAFVAIFEQAISPFYGHNIAFLTSNEALPTTVETAEGYTIGSSNVDIFATPPQDAVTANEITEYLMNTMEASNHPETMASPVEHIPLDDIIPNEEGDMLGEIMTLFNFQAISELSQDSLQDSSVFIQLSSGFRTMTICIVSALEEGAHLVWIEQKTLVLNSARVIPFISWLQSLAGATVRMFSSRTLFQ